MPDNLTTIKDRFGKKYRVERDECGDYQIPLREGRGFVFAWAEDELAAEILSNMPMKTFNAIKRQCPEASVHVYGDGEIIILCPITDAKNFLRICGAKTKRQISEEERQRLADMSIKFSPFRINEKAIRA
jgi:hypothetical protein